MKNTCIVIILIFYLTSFGQNKFAGKYKKFHEFSDTLKYSFQEPLNFRRFEIKDNFTYIYTEGQDPLAFSKPYKESIKGSWKSNGDTIIFYNKNFIQPKPIEIKYIVNQDFKGIKIIAKDKKGKVQKINYCTVDSLVFETKAIWTGAVGYREVNKNYVHVSDTSHVGIHFQPKGFCNENGVCEIYVDLTNIKSGTLIEVSFHSKDIELRLNEQKYILTGNVLHEYILMHLRPDPFTDNFIKRK